MAFDEIDAGSPVYSERGEACYESYQGTLYQYSWLCNMDARCAERSGLLWGRVAVWKALEREGLKE